ncbi:MAG: hypothetical protein HQK58_11555 [Deltaproteobacteria bacterium]|nr:hypothetical protein [Deltaproteobacteria bacterium]
MVISGERRLLQKDGKRLVIDASISPIIELSSGRKVILDFLNQLHPEEFAEINAQSGSYRLIKFGSNPDLQACLNQTFEEAGYVELNKGGRPFTLDREIRMTLNGDAVVSKVPDPTPADPIFVINFISDKSKRTAPYVVLYLKGHNIKVLDFLPNGLILPPEPIKDLGYKCPIVKTDSPMVALSDFLDFIRVPYRRGNPVVSLDGREVAPDKAQPTSKTLSLKYSGQDFLIYLDNVTPSEKELLDEKHINVISILPEDQTEAALSKLLNGLSIQYTETTSKLWGSTRPANKNIQFFLPGTGFEKDKTRYMITQVAIPTALAIFWKDNGIMVAQLVSGQRKF